MRTGCASLVVALAATSACSATADVVSQTRDEDAFVAYVITLSDNYESKTDPVVNNADARWVERHVERVVAAGDKVCDWLAEQPEAKGNADGATIPVLVERLREDSSSLSHLSLSPRMQRVVIVGAWAHLCRDVRDDAVQTPNQD